MNMPSSAGISINHANAAGNTHNPLNPSTKFLS
jgi:hypothetical protein